MKKQTIGIFSVISVSLLLFFQNCGKFETVSLEDELKLSSVNTFSDTAKKLLGLTCTANTVIACELNGQSGYKYCEGGKFSECRGQNIVDGNINDNIGMQPPIKYTGQGSWTMPGTTCRNKADEYGNFIVGTTTQLYDRYGVNCGYSCECVETDPSDRSKVSWACTKDGNITIPGVKGMIGYVPSKLLNEEVPLTAITEKRPSPTDSNVLIPVSSRQHNSLNPLRYVEVMQSGTNQVYRLLFTPIPVDCFTVTGKCTITDKFEYSKIPTDPKNIYVFVQYKSNPAEMLAELKRAMNLIIPDFEVNFVIKNAFTTQATDSQIRVRMSRSGGGTFKFLKAKSFYDDSEIPDNDQRFHFFREIGFSSITSLSSDQNTFISDSDYKLALDKTNAILYPKSDKDLEQNYFLTKAVKLYSLSSVTNSLLFKFEGNLISTTLIASRQDESFNIDEKATTIDVSKTNTTCSSERNISSDANNPKFVKYMQNVIPGCSDWYMFLYGDGKSETLDDATEAIKNFNSYTFRVGYKVNDFYLNPNVTRKYLAISSYLMLVEQRADVAWPSLNVPKLAGGRNMTENNMILRESLGIHPVEMYYKTYGYDSDPNKISLNLNNILSNRDIDGVGSKGETCLSNFGSFNLEHLYEYMTGCAYITFKSARALKFPGVKWSELIYNDDKPVVPVLIEADLSGYINSNGKRLDKGEMIAQGVGMYIIRLPLVKKILVTTKGPMFQKGWNYDLYNKFSITFHNQGVINTEQSPDMSKYSSFPIDYQQRQVAYPSFIGMRCLPDEQCYEIGGLHQSFFFDINLNFTDNVTELNQESYINSNRNLHNYATYAVMCTAHNGLYCPTIGAAGLNVNFRRSENRDEHIFTELTSEIFVNERKTFFGWDTYHFTKYDDKQRLAHEYLYRNVSRDTKFGCEDPNYSTTDSVTELTKVCRIWIERYLTSVSTKTETWDAKNLIVWQYELDTSIKSEHKITMYHRAFEPRPEGNTMTNDPIPYSLVIRPSYSILPPSE